MLWPDISISTLAVKLKPAAEKKVKQGHPWIFEGGIQSINKDGRAGDVAVVFDKQNNKFLACGLYDPDSPIRVKLMQFKKSARIDEQWFIKHIGLAHQKRNSLLASDTNAYRLINGENDFFPGLIADVYDSVLVLKLYSAIWFPHLQYIVPALLEKSKTASVLLRLSRRVETQFQTGKINEEIDPELIYNGATLEGTLPNEVVVFKEHGISLSANLLKGHKTGFFLDHRENRRRVGKLAAGKMVLDVFCYAGGFAVHALCGGALEVHAVDISQQALQQAKQNAALNKYDGKLLCIEGDAFKVLESMQEEGQQYDLVIIDPPSFAKKETERGRALTSYRRLASNGAALVADGGTLLLASCSARISSDEFFELNEEVLSQSGRKFKLADKTFHDVDHPIGFPEGAYLKTGYYEF